MRRVLSAMLLVCVTISLSAQKPTKYSLKVGDKFEFTSVADQSLVQTVMNQEQATDQEITAKEEIEVMAFENGVYTMKSTNLMQVFDMSSPMGGQTIHSDSAGLNNLPFRIMKGTSYTFSMKETGEVTSVMGLEELRSSMKEKLAGTIYEANADQITGVYEEKTLMNQLNVTYFIYPENSVNEWTNSYSTVVNNIPVDFTTKLYWDDEDTIFGVADVKLEGDIEMQGMSIQMNLGGGQKAIIDVDPATGMPTKIQSIQDMDGEMMASGMTVPMTMNTEVTTTISKK